MTEPVNKISATSDSKKTLLKQVMETFKQPLKWKSHTVTTAPTGRPRLKQVIANLLGVPLDSKTEYLRTIKDWQTQLASHARDNKALAKDYQGIKTFFKQSPWINPHKKVFIEFALSGLFLIKPQGKVDKLLPLQEAGLVAQYSRCLELMEEAIRGEDTLLMTMLSYQLLNPNTELLAQLTHSQGELYESIKKDAETDAEFLKALQHDKVNDYRVLNAILQDAQEDFNFTQACLRYCSHAKDPFATLAQVSKELYLVKKNRSEI